MCLVFFVGNLGTLPLPRPSSAHTHNAQQNNARTHERTHTHARAQRAHCDPPCCASKHPPCCASGYGDAVCTAAPLSLGTDQTQRLSSCHSCAAYQALDGDDDVTDAKVDRQRMKVCACACAHAVACARAHARSGAHARCGTIARERENARPAVPFLAGHPKQTHQLRRCLRRGDRAGPRGSLAPHSASCSAQCRAAVRATVRGAWPNPTPCDGLSGPPSRSANLAHC